MRYSLLFANDPALPIWGVMDHRKWCVVVCAWLAIDCQPASGCVEAYNSAVREGIVFA